MAKVFFPTPSYISASTESFASIAYPLLATHRWQLAGERRPSTNQLRPGAPQPDVPQLSPAS